MGARQGGVCRPSPISASSAFSLGRKPIPYPESERRQVENLTYSRIPHGHLNLATEVIERRFELPVREPGLRVRRHQVAAWNDLGVALVLRQVVALPGRQLDDLVGDNAPLVGFLAGSARLVEILAARSRQRRGGDLEHTPLKGITRLEATLAERALPDNVRSGMILQAR